MARIQTILQDGSTVWSDSDWDSTFLEFKEGLWKAGVPLTYQQANVVFIYFQNLKAQVVKQTYPLNFTGADAAWNPDQQRWEYQHDDLKAAVLLLLNQESSIISGTLEAESGLLWWTAATSTEQSFFILFKK